jgi:membrane AbrB-like protein
MLAQTPPTASDIALAELADTPLTPSPTRRWGLARLGHGQWAALLALTLAIAYLFDRWHVASALFLGPLVAGLAFAFGGSTLKVSRKVTIGSQAVIGCMIARSLKMSILTFVMGHWSSIAAVIAVTALSSIVVGIGLTMTTRLSGQTAAWGSMPGAAGVMVALATEDGGDPRLVAFMQYVRLIVVLSTASAVSTVLLGIAGHPAATPAAAAAAVAAHPANSVDVGPIAAVPTIVLAVLGMVLGRLSRIPAGPLLVTAFIGAVIQFNGVFQIAVPFWLLALSYGAVGWFVGLQFDLAVLRSALRNLPAMVGAIVLLILLCALGGMVISHFLGGDFLTGYLATSPGAIDSIAIIALNGHVDMSVVMAVQTLRFFAVILMAPYLVKIICRFTPSPSTA